MPARMRKKPRRFHDSLLPDVPASSWVESSCIDNDADTENHSPDRKSTKVSRAKRHDVAVHRLAHNASISRVLGAKADIRSAEMLEALTNLTLTALPTLDQKHVQFLLTEIGTATFVAHTVADRVIGGLSLRRAHSDMFQLSLIVVDECSRHRCLGSRLLKRAMHHARQYRVDYIAAYADHSALSFFLSRGFTDTRTLPAHLYQCLDHYTQSTLVVATLASSSPLHRAHILATTP